MPPHPGTALGLAAASQGAAGADPPAHQPDHPATGRAVPHQPIRQSTASSITWCRYWPARCDPAPDNTNHPWIIDGTLIPAHDQSITAISKNYRRSVNTQIIICAHRRRSGRSRPMLARSTATTSSWPATPWPTCSMAASSSATADTAASPRSPARDATTPAASSATTTTGCTAGSGPASSTSSPDSKTGKSSDQCRRRGDAINHSLHIIAGLWNLKTHTQLRVNP